MACILFVDDDYFTLKTYERIIALLGHQALVAGSAEDALLVLTDQQPDLIVVVVETIYREFQMETRSRHSDLCGEPLYWRAGRQVPE